MKKVKYIIAAFFVVAIGTIVFLSCDKNLTEEDNITSKTQQIQKDGENIFYYNENEPGVYYWASSGISFTLQNEIVLEDGHQQGSLFRDPETNKVTALVCINGGTNCGVAKEKNSSGEVIREGLWVEEENIIYVIFNQ